jgi:hypothetical protein
MSTSCSSGHGLPHCTAPHRTHGWLCLPRHAPCCVLTRVHACVRACVCFLLQTYVRSVLAAGGVNVMAAMQVGLRSLQALYGSPLPPGPASASQVRTHRHTHTHTHAGRQAGMRPPGRACARMGVGAYSFCGAGSGLDPQARRHHGPPGHGLSPSCRVCVCAYPQTKPTASAAAAPASASAAKPQPNGTTAAQAQAGSGKGEGKEEGGAKGKGDKGDAKATASANKRKAEGAVGGGGAASSSSHTTSQGQPKPQADDKDKGSAKAAPKRARVAEAPAEKPAGACVRACVRGCFAFRWTHTPLTRLTTRSTHPLRPPLDFTSPHLITSRGRPPCSSPGALAIDGSGVGRAGGLKGQGQGPGGLEPRLVSKAAKWFHDRGLTVAVFLTMVRTYSATCHTPAVSMHGRTGGAAWHAFPPPPHR